MESRRTSYTAENQSCQRSEGLAEGIYASPISSNSEQKGDLGLTQLPRSQISNASDEAEENAHSIQGLQVNSPVQDDAVVGESHALNLGSDGNGKHGSSGAYNYDWNDIEWASYDFDGAFNGIEELIDGKSTVGEAFSGTSTSPGSTPCDVPAWKVLSSENSRQSAPQTDHRNVVNSKITVKTDRSKKSVSSLGQRPPFRRSDPRDTRPSFSSFSRRPDPSVSQTTNPWRLQRDGHDLHSQTSAPSTDSNDEATHTDRYWLNDHSPYPNLRDEKSQANCSTSLENQMLDNFEMGGVNIGDALQADQPYVESERCQSYDDAQPGQPCREGEPSLSYTSGETYQPYLESQLNQPSAHSDTIRPAPVRSTNRSKAKGRPFQVFSFEVPGLLDNVREQ